MTAPDAQVFADLALSLHERPTMGETVDRLLEFAVKAVDCAHAGVIFVHKGPRVETFAATSPLVERLDQLQFEAGEGPDLDLVDDRHQVVVADTGNDPRWPTWAAAVAATGIRSMLGVRLHTDSTTIGSLNLYDEHVDHFSPVDAEVALLVARHAAVALDTAQETENLWHAIDARGVIGQAQGILMERFALDADQAFAVLRRYSQDHNVKLHGVAVRLIDTRRLPN